MSREVFLAGPVRTPHGRYGGTLRGVRTVELAALAVEAALARASAPATAVDELILACCRQAGNGPNPGRQVALRAGLPEPVPAQTLNMACASGLKAMHLAAQAVAAGDADLVAVVAAESMSTMPYLGPPELRWQGNRRGDITLVDGWRDGGTDPVCGLNMGQTAERIAERFGVDRAAQDAWAARSHQRVAQAWQAGRFDAEVVPVPVDEGTLSWDETFRVDSDPAVLARLQPAFVAHGTVTAGNASQMADGAAALVVAGAEAVRRYGLTPLGRWRSFAAVGVDPTVMGVGPVYAIPPALARAGRTVADVDLFEINEAFAAQIVHNVR
jgi:acetyl-CoA acetyltransferase family protein